MRGIHLGKVVHGFALGGVVMLLLPLVVVLGASVSDTGYITFPPEGFSLRAYADALQREQFIDSFVLSAQIAVVVAVLATLLGLCGAVGSSRVEQHRARQFETLFMTPLGMPHLVLGVAVLQLLGLAGLSVSVSTLAAGHLILALPFAARLIGAALEDRDPNMDRAAAILGASEAYAFRRVTLPWIRPALLASLFITANVSFDNVGVSLFLATAEVVTLPVRMFTYLEQFFDPFIAGFGGILIVVPIVCAVAIERFFGLGRLFGISTPGDR